MASRELAGSLGGAAGAASALVRRRAPDPVPAAPASVDLDPASLSGHRHVPAAGFADLDLGRLELPVLLMNLPLSLSTAEPNNVIMEQLGPAGRQVDLSTAIGQFAEAYRLLSRHALVYLLPSRPGLQDQVYVSNLGVVLPHVGGTSVVVSRFRSPPRVGEAEVGFEFFKLLNFTAHVPPARFRGQPLYFEGEADLKHLRGNLYVGAQGLRTSASALAWLSETFDMEIIPFPIRDPQLYHLDCSLLPLDRQSVVLCTEVADPAALRAIEKRCEVIAVSREGGYAGITNSVILGDRLICDTTIATIRREDPWYPREVLKIETLERICSAKNLRLECLNMAEFYKSGAALSCLVMRLNHPDRVGSPAV